MPTIFSALLLVGGAVLVCYVFLSIEKRRISRKKNQVLKKFSELGSKYSLSFTGQEILRQSVIGLDGMNRKLLVFQDHGNELFTHTLINLDEVRSCKMEVQEIVLDMGGAYELYQDKKISRISLCFHFNFPKDPVAVCFYDEEVNDEREEDDLADKARDWEVILTKMLDAKQRYIA